MNPTVEYTIHVVAGLFVMAMIFVVLGFLFLAAVCAFDDWKRNQERARNRKEDQAAEAAKSSYLQRTAHFANHQHDVYDWNKEN